MTVALSDHARATTIEALATQLQTDATNLADLAQTLRDTPTPVSIEDAVNCANLVAATASAIKELTA